MSHIDSIKRNMRWKLWPENSNCWHITKGKNIYFLRVRDLLIKLIDIPPWFVGFSSPFYSKCTADLIEYTCEIDENQNYLFFHFKFKLFILALLLRFIFYWFQCIECDKDEIWIMFQFLSYSTLNFMLWHFFMHFEDMNQNEFDVKNITN